MSADNGVYIIQTVRKFIEESPGCFVKAYSDSIPIWRVAHIGAIDNYDYYRVNEPYNSGAYIYDCFKSSPVFLCEEDALVYAFNLNKKIQTEYGVSHLELPDDFVFYGDM